MAVVLTERYST